MKTSLAVGLCLLCVVACAVEAPESAEGAAGSLAENDAIAVTTAALGSWSVAWSQEGADAAHQGSTYLAYVSPTSCTRLEVINTTTYAWVNVPAVPACVDGYVVRSDDRGIVLSTGSNHRIYALPITNGVPGSWLHIDNTGAYVDQIFIDATNVYYEADTSIYRVARTGGPTATLAHNRALLGIDGGQVYTASLEDASSTLYRMTASGQSEIALYTTGAYWEEAYSGLSFDACCAYWAHNPSQGTHRILRLTKDGLSLSTFKSSNTEAYYLPKSTGSSMYFFEENLSTQTTRFRRKNLSNGNWVTVGFPFVDDGLNRLSSLVIKSDRVSVLLDSGQDWTLYRGTL